MYFQAQNRMKASYWPKRIFTTNATERLQLKNLTISHHSFARGGHYDIKLVCVGSVLRSVSSGEYILGMQPESADTVFLRTVLPRVRSVPLSTGRPMSCASSVLVR